jgi:hypothetical protein
MQSALEKRAKLDIYPFKNGLKQAKDWKKCQDGNITSVRLCFEVLYKVTHFCNKGICWIFSAIFTLVPMVPLTP